MNRISCVLIGIIFWGCQSAAPSQEHYQKVLDAQVKNLVLSVYTVAELASAADFSPERYVISDYEMLEDLMEANDFDLSQYEKNGCGYLGYTRGATDSPDDNHMIVLSSLSDGALFIKSNLDVSPGVGSEQVLSCDGDEDQLTKMMQETIPSLEGTDWHWISFE